MRQYLEQRMYEPIQESRKNLRVYQIEDLESLSASVLYTDKLPKFSAGGAGFELPRFAPKPPPDIPLYGNLTIRDFPASGFQLHIHEGAGGSAHILDYARSERYPISSYDAAMADVFADNSAIKKILEKSRKLKEEWPQ